MESVEKPIDPREKAVGSCAWWSMAAGPAAVEASFCPDPALGHEQNPCPSLL